MFGGGGAGGNGFGVEFRDGAGGGGEGGGLPEIIQAMQMNQLPLHVYQGFDGGGVSSGSGGLRGIGRMHPWRRGGWPRGR